MAAPKKDEKEKLAPIIVKKIIKKSAGHHGGAWKVAYADFVTAMMAFFLLLWLLNVTTKEQKNAISNYFDPSHPRVSDVVSGAGGILGGMTVAPEGAMVSNVQPLVQQEQTVSSTHGEMQGQKSPTGEESEEELAKQLRAKEDARFNQAADKLKADMAASADLKDLQKNLMIDITPEGLRIQIVDDQGRSMFPSGSAAMYDFMRKILLKVTSVVTPLPNQVSVRGHTDSAKYKDPNAYDNWNLSADRAQASRRVMIEGGLPEKRVENVMGRADREPLEKDPAAARNRRISIILLRERLTKDVIEKLKSEKAATDAAAAGKGAVALGQGTGLTIIDDTKPQATPAVVKPADPNAAKPEYSMPEDMPNLPVTPGAETTIKRQPQVMYFNNDGTIAATKPADEKLYDGPAQSPYSGENKPPTITKSLFHLDDDGAKPAAETPTAAPAPAPVPIAPKFITPTQPVKTLDFGDPVPAQTKAAPVTLPSATPVQPLDPNAPAATLPPANNGAAPASTATDAQGKSLEF